MNSPSLWLRLFLPFAAGYFLSYLYRTANAVIGPLIAGEMQLHDNALGLLTSTYFLAFGAAQLPLGILLDRYGPRRVEAGLLTIAAAGPLKLALDIVGWREIMLALAALTLIVAVALWRFVPDKPSHGERAGFGEQLRGVRDILRHPHFWRYAPMGLFFTGGFMAVQGLWASRWMSVIEALDAAEIAARLTWIGSAMLGGFLFMGFFATRLVHRGIPLERIYRSAMATALAAFALLCAFPAHVGNWLWPVLGACFSLSNIAYSLVAQAFPEQWSGRANTAFNLFVFVGAFGLQWGIGGLVDVLQAGGYSVAPAYRIAFCTLLAAQALAFGWLLLRGRQR